MKKVIYFCFAQIAYSLILFSCAKEKDPEPPKQDQLPPITQTGAYTFGCLLDGEVWLPKHYSNSIVNPPVVLQASLDTRNGNLFSVIADHDREDEKNSPRQKLALYIFIDVIKDTVVFPPGYTEGPGFSYQWFPPKTGGDFKLYHSTGNKNSWIYLSRFDTVNRIASGTFSVDLVNKDDDQDTVRIREGRFDVPF